MNLNLIHVTPARRAIAEAELPVVYVVDGDPVMREAFQALIRSAGWRPCVAASAEEFLAQPRCKTACCLLLEKDLPGLNGLELQKLVLDRTEMPVIFMSSDNDVEATVQAMKAGAIEFFCKPCVGDVLLHAIGHAIKSSRAAMHHQAQQQALQQRYESLSRREREVMNLVVVGRLNKQVGGDLGISEITVKAHRGKMMRKMQAGSLAQLVNMAASLHSDDLPAYSS
ncbi:MAG TPA: LuxR C-terminal-related transcriptional regulator [Povalibacter sp.]